MWFAKEQFFQKYSTTKNTNTSFKWHEQNFPYNRKENKVCSSQDQKFEASLFGKNCGKHQLQMIREQENSNKKT